MTVAIDYFTHMCVCVCVPTAFKWQLERQGMLIKATPVLGVWGQLAMVAGLLATSFGCLSAVIGK